MKYLKFFESSLVDSKINLIETLFLEIYDEGFDYYVLKGSGSSMQISLFDGDLDSSIYPSSTSVGSIYHKPSRFIYVVVTKDIREFSESDKNILEDFTEKIRDLGMSPRGGWGGHNFRIFYFDKWGKMTDSNLLL